MPQNSPYAIALKGLTKTYAATKKMPAKQALKGIDLCVEKGSMFALLGPNGAGKSTLINILAGLVLKSAGEARVWDYAIDTHMREAKCAIGIVPQELNLDAFFTPTRLLELQAGLYGVPKSERRTAELLETVGLTKQAHAYSRSLSGGMRRRLMVAKAMVHTPPILVLDEPTAGVDVELRRALWDYVKELNRKGVTVLLTTHYLEEAQELCDRIAIINHGTVIVNEAKTDLLKRLDSKELRLTLAHPPPATLPDTLTPYYIKQGDAPTNQLVLRYPPSTIQAGRLLEAVQQAGFHITDISTREADLEDVFIQLTSAKAANG